MRLEVTNKSELVLRALCALATRPGRSTGAEMAEHLGVSRQIVPKLMDPLVKAGWVSSTPGPSGGYELAADLKQISLLELIEAVEGPTENDRCVLRGTPCPAVERCAMHDAWLPARTALLEKLRAISIEELRKSPALCGPTITLQTGPPARAG